MMEEGFFCDVLGWLQLFQFSFVISYVILCHVLFAYLILFSIFWKEFGWVLFWFCQAGLDLAIEVILQVYVRRVEYQKSCWRDSKLPIY